MLSWVGGFSELQLVCLPLRLVSDGPLPPSLLGGDPPAVPTAGGRWPCSWPLVLSWSRPSWGPAASTPMSLLLPILVSEH